MKASGILSSSLSAWLPIGVLIVAALAAAAGMFLPTDHSFRFVSFVLAVISLTGTLGSVIGGMMIVRKSRLVGLVCIILGLLLLVLLLLPAFSTAKPRPKLKPVLGMLVTVTG
jgi:hypothetical protein